MIASSIHLLFNTFKFTMSRLLLIAVLIAVGHQLQAQNIQLKEEPLISQMMNKFTDLNKSSSNLEGWRIQILATTDRQRLESVRQTFQYRYPNIPVDWVHTKPYYKLRAGAFSSKLEALRLKYILEQDYPGTYPVRDKNIRPQEIIGY